MAALEAKSFRPLSEFLVHYINDFLYRDEFFIQHVHVLVRVFYENLGRPQDGSFYTDKLNAIARDPVQSGSVMSYEDAVQPPVCDPVSSYPSYYVICSSLYQFRQGEIVGSFSKFIGSPIGFELLRRSVCLLGGSLIRSPILFGAPVDLQLGFQFHFYDLKSSEREKRGIKRPWLIAWNLGQDAAHRQQIRYKGVRHRRAKYNTKKPWTAEVHTCHGEKVRISDYGTAEEAARAHDVGAVYYGKGREDFNFEHIPRLLPEIPLASSRSQKENMINLREQVQHLRRNPLFCLIYEVPEEIFLQDIYLHFERRRVELQCLMSQLIRSVRKKRAAPPLIEISGLPTDIPLLLESMIQIIEQNVSPICDGVIFRLVPWDFL